MSDSGVDLVTLMRQRHRHFYSLRGRRKKSVRSSTFEPDWCSNNESNVRHNVPCPAPKRRNSANVSARAMLRSQAPNMQTKPSTHTHTS